MNDGFASFQTTHLRPLRNLQIKQYLFSFDTVIQTMSILRLYSTLKTTTFVFFLSILWLGNLSAMYLYTHFVGFLTLFASTVMGNYS